MDDKSLAVLHIAAAVLALLAGALVLGSAKGTRWHRLMGRLYVTAMLVLNLSALNIYRLSGEFGAFHVAALFSLLVTLTGVTAVRWRWLRGGWLDMHFHLMSWSYVGLVAAAVSESAVRVPAVPFWPAVGIGTFLVMVLGAVIIRRQQARVLGKLRRSA